VLPPVTLRREVVEVVHRDAAGQEFGAQEITPALPEHEQR
jgi:hypothetical protein